MNLPGERETGDCPLEPPSPSAPYSGIEMLEVIAAAVNYNRWLADIVITALEGRRPVLDFGAGSGTFSRVFRANGVSVACVEPDATLAGRLRDEGFEVHSTVESMPGASVGAIYSLNVLEHIEDDAAALRELHRVLMPGGRLILYVPAFPLLFSSFDARYGHQRRYRKSDLRALVERAGFRVRACRYADSLGFWAALIFKLVDRGSAGLSTSSIRVYDRVIFPISRRFDAVAGNFFGKNVLLIADNL